VEGGDVFGGEVVELAPDPPVLNTPRSPHPLDRPLAEADRPGEFLKESLSIHPLFLPYPPCSSKSRVVSLTRVDLQSPAL